MKGEWCYWKNYFTPEECAKIIEDGLTITSKDATLGVEGAKVDKETRRSKIRFIQKTDPRFKWVFDKLWLAAIQSNDEWFKFNITKITYLQLAEYDESYQGEYKIHKDVFWINNDLEYHRKITCVVQLTEPSKYDGGDFELYYLSQDSPDKEEIRSLGTAIFLPSFIDHAALPVTKGTRYSLAAWFDGPKFV